MEIFLKNNRKQTLLFTLVLLQIASLLLGRAALSIISAGMVLPVFFTTVNRQEIKKLLFASALIIMPVLISGLWSDDKALWWQAFSVKIPLITIGTGLLAIGLNARQLKQLIWLLNGIILAGCIWSLFQFINDKEAITRSYLVAKVMPTILDDDHIRFSWLVTLGIILLSWQLAIRSNKSEKIIGAVVIVVLILFLHLLASKTGLLCLYASIVCMIFYFLFKAQSRKQGLILLVVIVSIAFTAYRLFPTLHNRVQYVLYDFGNYSGGKFENGSSDGARILSMKAGWFIAKQHPLKGVGFGDLKQSINDWHQLNHPISLDYERFNPTNEWLIYAAASGLLGMLLFSFGLILLIQLFTPGNIFAFCLIISLVLPLITDDSLEGQYGVAIFIMVFCLGYYLQKQEYS
jgi:hypothetical protein